MRNLRQNNGHGKRDLKSRPTARREPATGLADRMRRMRLARLEHSKDDRAAAIATACGLLLVKLDRLLKAIEEA